MEVKRWELMPHVYLTYLPARKFKTGVLSAHVSPENTNFPLYPL